MADNYIGNFLSSAKGVLRKVKVAVFGPGDVREVPQAAPFGIDSAPVKGMTGVYVGTEQMGKRAVVGYYNGNGLPEQAKAETGEVRLFATDASGNFVFNIWLRANGEVLVGDSDEPAEYVNWLVKYTELKAAWSAQQTAINNNLNLIATGLNAIVPGSYTPVLVTTSMTSAKAEKIKTI
ncbi:MAG: hypothetical protein KF744_09035 [Taibaiella sp.]|nr:hypothetical protein [Taibaiella sp.]